MLSPCFWPVCDQEKPEASKNTENRCIHITGLFFGMYWDIADSELTLKVSFKVSISNLAQQRTQIAV